ncbi:hypothetical protein [Neptuniibacter sp.]|uniref:hypothetical protein n=1 Tax=Neptuniibacter sp. TaxID=1962643 RepID=UPI0026335CFB|nr:hypothetical protein [Neptuniibacter sp.]MCP4595144.1 hypothetical protein [Neptuniibacter sp.]
MSKFKFVIFLAVGFPWFFAAPKILSFIDPLVTNGFINFFLKFCVTAPAFIMILSALFSLMASGIYLLVRPDPELKKLSSGMFSFFIWKELKK